MAGEPGASRDMTSGDYARVVWRRKQDVIGVTVAVLGMALGHPFVKAPMRQASATHVFETLPDASDSRAGSSVGTRTLETELARARRWVFEEAARPIRYTPCRKVGLEVVRNIASQRCAPQSAARHVEGEPPFDATTGGNAWRARVAATLPL